MVGRKGEERALTQEGYKKSIVVVEREEEDSEPRAMASSFLN